MVSRTKGTDKQMPVTIIRQRESVETMRGGEPTSEDRIPDVDSDRAVTAGVGLLAICETACQLAVSEGLPLRNPAAYGHLVVAMQGKGR